MHRGGKGANPREHMFYIKSVYTLWISSCIATARERIPGSIDNSVTGVSECNQQRGSLKDDGYSNVHYLISFIIIDLGPYSILRIQIFTIFLSFM